jgi:hypothetical protein
VTLIVEYAQPTPSCGLGIPVLNPAGYVHNGGPEKIKPVPPGGSIGVFTNSGKVNTQISTWTHNTNSVYRWNFIMKFNPAITAENYFFGNNSKVYFPADKSAGTKYDYVIGYSITAGVGITKPTGWNLFSVVFDAGAGTVNAYENGVSVVSYNQPLLVGYDPRDAAMGIGTYSGAAGGQYFKGWMAYADMSVDGNYIFKYDLGKISGSVVTNLAGGTNGVATSITTSNDVDSIYIATSRLGTNSFWTTNSLTWNPRSYSDIITNTSQTIIVTTNDHLVKQLITKGQP